MDRVERDVEAGAEAEAVIAAAGNVLVKVEARNQISGDTVVARNLARYLQVHQGENRKLQWSHRRNMRIKLDHRMTCAVGLSAASQ